MKFIYNMKIRSKLVVGFSLIVLITIGVGLFAAMSFSRLAAETELSDRLLDTYGKRTETLYYAMRWGYPVFREAEALMLYSQTDDFDEQQTLFEMFGAAGREFREIREEIRKYASTEEELTRIEEIDRMQKEIQTDAIMLIAIRDGEGEYGAETREALLGFQEKVGDFVILIEDLVALENESMLRIRGESKNLSSAIRAETDEAITVTLLVCLAAVLIASLVSFLLYRAIVPPLTMMASAARHIASGDITKKIRVKTSDEMGDMAHSFNEMTDGLHDSVLKIKHASTNIASVSDETSTTADILHSGAETQASYIDSVSASIEEMNASIKETANNTTEASTKTNEAARSVEEISTSIESVAGAAEGLNTRVEEVSASIAEMAASIKEIASHASHLSKNTEETASSVTEINASAKAVENIVSEAAMVSEATAMDAEAGGNAVRDTIAGMDAINDAVLNASEVMKGLGDQSTAIGNLITIINDIADLTGLLSFNATIIAAQAGEHGKGFAVVAGEMSDLASRTRVSAKEIENLIGNVRGNVSNAISHMDTGTAKVKDGVELAGRAGKALEKILSGAKESKKMVSQIATASKEQIRASAQGSKAMENITHMLSKVYEAIEEQEKGSSYIARAAEDMRDGATTVSELIHVQNRESDTLSKAIKDISDMIGFIDRATQEQALGSMETVKSIEKIKEVTATNASSVNKLKEATGSLVTEADALFKGVERFKVT